MSKRESYIRADEDTEVEFKETSTARGFELIEFTDYFGQPCSIQASSLALYEQPGISALWIGARENRMHLTVEGVKAVRDYLTRWIDHKTLKGEE